MIKKIIPSEIRLQLRLFQKKLKDIASGQSRKMITKDTEIINFSRQLKLSQAIRPNDYSENKIQNLRLATSCIKNKMIPSGAIFSFWKLIPAPTKENGFKKGRNLIGDGLSLDYGGGLCQLSGILYHLSLIGGLNVIERFPHSKDIYTEESRYTPLGSDAAVVYGHKDLRILNNLSQALSFDFEISKDEIIAYLCAKDPITPYEIVFEAIRKKGFSQTEVSRKLGDQIELISKDKYDHL